MNKPTNSVGLFFLANDSVAYWVVAFLNSLRTHNPTLDICLIPFDDNTCLLRELQSHYGYSIFSQNEVLEECDTISRMFHEDTRGLYRKLACWSGPYERFIYVDTDTVVTQNIDWIYSLVREYDFIFTHAPNPNNRQYVWKESIYGADVLTPEQIEFSANAGFFASSRSSFTREQIFKAAMLGAQISIHMDLGSSDQAFMNFLAVTSGKPYTSLSTLSKKGDTKVAFEFWAGYPGGLSWKGNLYYVGVPCNPRLRGWRRFRPFERPIFLIHWAGYETKRRHSLKAIEIMRMICSLNLKWVITPRLRYKSLWLYYANKCAAAGRYMNLQQLAELSRNLNRKVTPPEIAYS